MVKGFAAKLLSLIFVIAGVAAAQSLTAMSAYGQKPKPTVKETLGWIQDSLNSDYGDIEKQTAKGTEIHTLRLADFSGCRVHFVLTEAVAGTETFHDESSFDLKDIDPVKSRFASRGITSNDPGLFTSVTQNAIKKIATKTTYGVTSIPAIAGSSALFVAEFYSPYGDDFAEAFTHAVKMCGGKPSIFAKSNTGDSDEQASPAASVVGAESASPLKDIPEIARAANGAIVSIVMSDKDGSPIAQGSGFLISNDGVILTNYHVIAEGSSAVVKLPEGAFYVVDGVLAFDKARDVAVIKAHGDNFRTLTLGNSDRLQVGEEVVAIGNPLSLESTVSNGIVSGLRTVEKEGGKFLQITTPISPGSSGGPLFNMGGEVVGITTLYLKGGENLNFAIPINDAKRLLLVESTKIQALPNEPEPVKAQTHNGDAPSSVSTTVAQTSPSPRNYYQQLYDAGGFSKGLPNAVCFSDDAHLGTFFTFIAYAADENYYNAQAKVQALHPVPTDPDIVTPEMNEQFNIMEAVQRTAPYVTFLMKGWLESFSPEAQKFFRGGGRILNMTLYEKGVKGSTAEWRWDGSAWVLPMKTEHPNARTQVSTIYRLSIEPTTMRYVRSGAVTITVGSGSTAANETDHYGPWGGVCEKVPNPK
ncbi:MAG: S1C family serine protease [Candidatus Acidiferrales bacterium]